MLKHAAEADEDTETKTDDALYCAACGQLLTRTRWALVMGEGHERVFINPGGHVFRIACFIEAPGALQVGPATDEHTWFPGYAWKLVLCSGCKTHVGWCFEGDIAPRIFFGLIKTALTQSPGHGQG